MTPSAPTAEDTGEAVNRGYTRQYPAHLTEKQQSIAKRWFGHTRCIRNRSRTLHLESDHVTAEEKLAAYVDEQSFLHELPASAIQHELDNDQQFSTNSWSSRKHDVQRVVISGNDFELTPRATIIIVSFGEVDVDFNEGIPEPFPTRIELLQDPAGDTSIRLHYAGEIHNV